MIEFTLMGNLIFFNITDKQDTDTPSMAHTALRELVERAVDEARKLPRLGESVSTKTQETTTTTTTSSTSTEPISEQSYEELLASAILNKVKTINLYYFIMKHQHCHDNYHHVMVSRSLKNSKLIELMTMVLFKKTKRENQDTQKVNTYIANIISPVNLKQKKKNYF